MAGSFPSRSWLGALALLLVVPLVGADAGDDVRQYKAFVHTSSSTTGEVPTTPVAIGKPHDWNRTAGQSILEIRASYIVQAGAATNPRADYQVIWDGTPITNCSWSLQGGTITGGRFNPAVSIFCQLGVFVEPGNHTVEVSRSNVVGEPVVQSTTSIILHQRESVNMNMEMNITNLELWIPIFLALALVVLGVLMGFDFVAVGGTVALVAMMFLDGVFMDIEAWKFAITLSLFGLLGEYVAYRRQDQIEKRDRRHTA